MSMETRSNSALFKRAEQLKRWEESDTNREPVSPKHKSRKVKFSSGCVFLAACAAGDKEEVLKLLEKGADINTANVDGLTALHQACIDDNLDMVEFLVDHGADVNRGDNEGWTPLHATASCGFMYIAKYLIEKGANVAAVNNDGELAIDIAECSKMEDLLRDEIHKRGIDCDAARNDEEIAMLRDAKEWLATKSSLVNEPHPKTGATALHVAAAKGYIDVMKILLQCGADVDAQDVDGWTPIHAAVHWGQEDACRLLVENLADLDAKNYVGQTAFDLADNDMLSLLEDLKKKQNKEEVNKRKAKKRAEAQDRTIEPDSQSQVKKVKVEITGGPEENTKNNDIEMDVSSESESETETETSESESEESSSEEDEKKNRVNSQSINDKVTIKEPEITKPPLPPKTIENSDEKMPWRQQITKPKSDLNSPDKSTVGFKDYKSDLNNENEVTLRRTKSFQNDESFYTKYKALHARIQAYNDSAVISPYNNPSVRPKSDIILTNSTESHYRSNKDEKSNEVSTSTANSTVTSSPTKTTSPATSPQPQNNQSAFRSGLRLALNQTTASNNASTNGSSTPTTASTPTSTTAPTSTVTAPTCTVTTPTTPGGTRFQIFKNFFKSFVPPVRDEESETQRKAHAKRVRETRRSTQGVTLEEIKSAEQLVKLKNQPNSNNNNDTSAGGGEATNPAVSVSVTISTGTPTVITRTETTTSGGTSNESSTNGSTNDNYSMSAPTEVHERRPSWRLKVDGGSKFKLEDATKPETPSTPSFVRRLNPTTNSSRPSSAPIETAETTVTIPLRRPKSLEEKEQDKENDVRNAQATLATQAAIQRRRRPKRRSTGVVSFDSVEDMDQEKDPSAGGDSTEATKLAQELNSTRNRLTRNNHLKMSSTFHHTPRSKQPVVPLRHRSSSAVRSGTASNSYSRPRSVGYYGSSTTGSYGGVSNPYSSSYGSTSSMPFSSYSGYNSSYGSSYQSPYFPNGYRGVTGASGYASLTIPAKALTNVNILTPNYSKSYDNNRDYIKNDAARRQSRELTRGSSHRERSLSRSRGSLPGSGMGSRSISLTSLNSEGYISGSERSSRSRISSTADIRNENGEIDYKKLYEEQLAENERLRDKLRKTDEDLKKTKQTLEKINSVTSKNSLSELEKRERRAMERKLSEMEEELKQLQKLKAENERLKADNRSLTRVINKLTNSAKK